MHRLDHLW